MQARDLPCGWSSAEALSAAVTLTPLFASSEPVCADAAVLWPTCSRNVGIRMALVLRVHSKPDRIRKVPPVKAARLIHPTIQERSHHGS
jgi:hypothetical protein